MPDPSRGYVHLSEKQRLLETTLDDLVTRKGIQGAVVVRRDGITVLHRGRSQFNPETFGAMCAVAVGAAETAFSELGPVSTPIIRAETKGHRLYVCDATREVVLVAIADRSVDWDTLGQLSTEAAKHVAKILAG